MFLIIDSDPISIAYKLARVRCSIKCLNDITLVCIIANQTIDISHEIRYMANVIAIKQTVWELYVDHVMQSLKVPWMLCKQLKI